MASVSSTFSSLMMSEVVPLFFIGHEEPNKLRYDVHQVGGGLEVSPSDILSDLSSFVFFKICLIDRFFNHNLSDFFDFVVVDFQAPTFKQSALKFLSCQSGLVRVLIAYEGKAVSILTCIYPNVFDFTKPFEDLFHLLLFPVTW